MYKIYDISRNGSIFDFMDGPPFVTGKLHMGHLAIGSIKSSFLNYKNMCGFSCNNKLGYDCHGVPIESIANRELNIKSNQDLENIGMEQFNTFCKETIRKFEKDWEPVYNKMARWADFNNVYKTMDVNFMESIWWGFSSLYENDLIYRSHKVVAYSYPLQSPLSNSEESQNYKDVTTKTVYVKFKLINEENTYFIAWTTTPWTLVANLALCVNKDLEYDYVLTESGETYIVGKNKHKNTGIKMKEILKTVKGSNLVGIKYEPIYKYYNDQNYFQVVEDNYVQESETNGTSIVHLAPTFGEDDYRVCKLKNIVTDDSISKMNPIDDNCNYTNVIKQYEGLLVFDAEPQILKYLKEFNFLLKIQSITHQYPYCYRTETPLIYRVCESFYVNVQKIKDRMIELNKETNWYPQSVGSVRFHQWLENARDWCISRSRYFGTPIPVWVSPTKKSIVIDSIDKLEKYSGIRVTDLHPEVVNKIEFTHDGELYKRVKDVFDCWFESGCVPFAQHHYPFENKDLIDSKKELSEFIVEGIDQTRGWFYTLLILSTALFNKKPAKNIMAIGLVLGENGKKISKKDGNFIDPNILIDQYGADSIRLYLLQSPLSHAEPFLFKEEDLKEIKQLLYRFKNATEFLKEHTHHQKVQNILFDKNAYKNATNAMDCWIMVHIGSIANEVKTQMDKYNLSKSVRMIVDLIEDITNWYLKFNRDRLKGKCGDEEWIMSTSVLNYIIKTYSILLAPFAPLISSEIYNDIKHLNDVCSEEEYEIFYNFYEFEEFKQHEHYITSFDLLKRISKIVRSARTNTKTHTSSKTPIKSCTIYMDSDEDVKMVSQTIDLIQTELNVIDIEYKKLTGNIKYKVLPNKSIIGKKYRNQSKSIVTTLEELVFDTKDIDTITLKLNDVDYVFQEEEFTLTPIFSENDYFDKDIMVQIDFTYDELIQNKHNIKCFVSEIQRTRKEMGLHVWNKISIEVELDELNIVSDNIDFIKLRLECDVNINSTFKSDRFYIDEDQDKKIGYSVKLL